MSNEWYYKKEDIVISIGVGSVCGLFVGLAWGSVFGLITGLVAGLLLFFKLALIPASKN